MKSYPSKLHGVTYTEQTINRDERGWSCQPFSLVHHNFWQNRFGTAVHTYSAFSKKGVIRGMHWQQPNPQCKFVQCVYGRVMAIVIDLRVGSPTFKELDAFLLSQEKTLYVPYGFALGYKAETDACVYYLIHGDYDQSCYRRCQWPTINGTWATMSKEDKAALPLDQIPKEWLFEYHGVDTR